MTSVILKKALTFIFLSSLIICLTPRFSKGEGVLNLYSARQEVLLRPLIKLFEKKHNIKVNIIAAKADQLINRLEQEGQYTKADVLLTVDVARLINAKEKGLFKPIISSNLNSMIPKQFRDSENHWFGLSLRGRIIIYNKNKVSKNQLKGYANLADEEWKGKILVRSSNNVYNQSLISAMLINYGEDKTDRFLKGFVSNFARKPAGGDRDQIKAVVSGVGDLALVNSYYFLNMKSKDNKNILKDLAVHFPEDSEMKTHVNISGAGIVKYSENTNNALTFLEYMVSNDAQKIYASVNFEYPIRKNLQLNDFIKEYKIPNKDKIALSRIGLVNKEAIIMMDKSGWK